MFSINLDLQLIYRAKLFPIILICLSNTEALNWDFQALQVNIES